jgi:hypothetical protein
MKKYQSIVHRNVVLKILSRLKEKHFKIQQSFLDLVGSKIRARKTRTKKINLQKLLSLVSSCGLLSYCRGYFIGYPWTLQSIVRDRHTLPLYATPEAVLWLFQWWPPAGQAPYGRLSIPWIRHAIRPCFIII